MEEEIQVKIKMTSNAQVYTVKVLKSDTILTLKEKCQKETEVPPESQNLVYKGRILANEKLVSDYKIENDHTIILVKKHSPSQPSTESKPTSSNTTANTSNNNANANNTNNNANNNNTNNNNNNSNWNNNPFMGMGGGQMPDLSQLGDLMGNIDPNELNSMMQNFGMGNLGNMGMNPQMMNQIFSNPMYMQMMQNMLQNPEMIQMALNSPQMRQMAQNNPMMQQMLNNPQLLQQMLNPQTLQMMSNLFQSMGGGANNPNNTNNNNNNNTNNNPPQMPPFDFSQMAGLLGNMGGMGGLFGNPNNQNNNAGNAGAGSGNGTNENFSNIGINDNNDANVDYKEKYKDQLAQMKDMGFVNEETNIQVLKQCSGNVQFAVEKLLNMLG